MHRTPVKSRVNEWKSKRGYIQERSNTLNVVMHPFPPVHLEGSRCTAYLQLLQIEQSYSLLNPRAKQQKKTEERHQLSSCV